MSSHRPASLHRLAGRYDNPTQELTILPPPPPSQGLRLRPQSYNGLNGEGTKVQREFENEKYMMRRQSSKRRSQLCMVGNRSNEKERKELWQGRQDREVTRKLWTRLQR
jgi:hypothetical protein